MTSNRFKQSAFAAFTSDVLLPLITITGQGFDPLRIVPNTQDIISGGATYSPFPVFLQLPDDDADAAPIMKFKVTSIAQEVVQRLRLVSDALYVDILIVLAATPDVIEMRFPQMRLRNTDFDAVTVSGDLILGDFLTESVPVHSFTPGFAPAVFKAS